MATITLPELETERLLLRPPRLEDFDVFIGFMRSERSEFVGGPTERRNAMRGIGHVAGLWLVRGYSLFVGERKDTPGQPIGMFGPWYPLDFPETEFGWSLWDGAQERQGFVTEAMRTIIPWAWNEANIASAVSFIDETNVASRSVAAALGAALDDDMTDRMNQPGSYFYEENGPKVLVYRHTKGSLR